MIHLGTLSWQHGRRQIQARKRSDRQERMSLGNTGAGIVSLVG